MKDPIRVVENIEVLAAELFASTCIGGCNWPIVWVAQCGKEIPDAMEIETAARSNARGDILPQTDSQSGRD